MDVEIKQLSKRFKDTVVFNDFSCTFEACKTTAIMGGSGCGKTTLLRILAGLDKDYTGVIIGFENKRLSIVFQEDRLCENISSFSNVKLVMNKKSDKQRIIDLLNEVGLKDSIYKPVRELSGGMKRRTALVRALCADYDVMLLDEAFKGLDEETKKQVIQIFKRETKGKTIIFVTHDPSEADMLGARIINI